MTKPSGLPHGQCFPGMEGWVHQRMGRMADYRQTQAFKPEPSQRQQPAQRVVPAP